MGFWQDLTEDEQGMVITAPLIALVLALFIGAVVYRSEYKTYVDDMSWRREITVERFKTVVEESTYLPEGARELDRWTETERYRCGSDSNGDAKYCYRSDTHYKYEIDKWVYELTLFTEGKDRNPYWHNTDDLNYSAGPIQLGDQRLGQHREMYSMYFTVEDSKTAVYTTDDLEQWLSFEIEYPVIITRNIVGGVVAVRKV